MMTYDIFLLTWRPAVLRVNYPGINLLGRRKKLNHMTLVTYLHLLEVV